MTLLAQCLADPVLDSQAVFRLALAALSRPGHKQALPPSLALDHSDLPPAAAALLVTLCDYETPLFLENALSAARPWLAFHTGAPEAKEPENATFAVATAAGATALLKRLPIGDDRYPDQSATLLILCDSLEGGDAVTLEGPGIETCLTIAPQGPGADFWDAARDNAALYPLGVDMVFVAGRDFIGLPRSTHIEGAR